MEVRVVRFQWRGGEERLVSLYSGCDVEEMKLVICAAFGVARHTVAPVALVALDTGVTIPFSVACRFPETLTAEAYTLLEAGGVDGSREGSSAVAGAFQRSGTWGGAAAAAAAAAAAPMGAAAASMTAEEGEETQAMAKVTGLLVKFSQLLESSGRLTAAEAANAVDLAGRGDTVLLAAYSVAASARDADFLATLIQRVVCEFTASNDGKREHVEAERLLLVIDALYAQHRAIELGDCRFLQSLVLAKDLVLFAALDVYVQDGDVKELFDTILTALETRKRELSGDDDRQATAHEAAQRQVSDAAASVADARQQKADLEARAGLISEISRALRDGAFGVACARALSSSLTNGEPLGILARSAYNAFEQNNDRAALQARFLEVFHLTQDTRFEAQQQQPQQQQQPPPRGHTESSDDDNGGEANEDDDAVGDDDDRIGMVRECVAWLREKRELTTEQTRALVESAHRGDVEIKAALEVYKSEGDLEDFLDTLTVLSAQLVAKTHRAEDAMRAATAAASPPHGTGENDDDDTDAATVDKGDVGDQVVVVDDETALAEILELVGCLEQDAKVGAAESDALRTAIDRRDDRLLAAYEVYVDTQDVDDLVDTLMRVAAREVINMRQRAAAAAADDDDDDDDEKEENQEEDASSFVQVFSDMARDSLTDVETAALQLCVARNDPDVTAVLDVYRLEHDKADLEDSLKRIARKCVDDVVNDTAPAATTANGDDDETTTTSEGNATPAPSSQ